MALSGTDTDTECRTRHVIRQPCVDKGWSWMVLLAACLIEFFMALSYTSGIFNVIFLDTFGKDKQTTAWVGSIQCSLLSLFGELIIIYVIHSYHYVIYN